MTQFNRHVIARAKKMPSTLNPYHGMLAKPSYTIFKPTSLFNGNAIDMDRLAAIASEFSTTADEFVEDTQVFFNHAPYKLPEKEIAGLLNKPPTSPFMSFLCNAILCHPPSVFQSLRRGKDHLTSSSFFFAHWVSQFGIKPDFDVGSFVLFVQRTNVMLPRHRRQIPLSMPSPRFV
jgi:hypothetical protein